MLSIDSGGVRGGIPALVVAHLERESKNPASELFDLIVGTSTGGMLAMGLSMQEDEGAPLFNASKMVKLYEAHGDEIVEQSLWRKLRTVGGVGLRSTFWGAPAGSLWRSQDDDEL